ncbi:MAG: hypothetical protein MJ201_02385 [Mycoplasmoidaceae bacterium]|nr:hypothetical protein [Mycoplasmoidaceae bacterium]
MMNKTIDTYINPDGTPCQEPISGIDALSKTLDYGISEIVSVSLKEGTAEKMVEAADNMVTS